MSSAERAAWTLGGAAAITCAIGWAAAPASFPHAWLAAYTCLLAWPLGSLALLMVHALTGGRWGEALRRQLLAGIGTLPLLLPALLPLPFVGRALYPWMHPEIADQLSNGFYLNVPFFYARQALYLLIWGALGLATLRALRREDCAAALYRLAPPALILLGLTVSFDAIDLTLSLDPYFKSSVYGLLVCVEAVLFALSIAIVGLAWAPSTRETVAAETAHVLGRLLLSLVVLWAYLDFMQLLIVWNSDLPDEAAWYFHRLSGGWAVLAQVIAGFHFALPFLALLWPQVQKSRRAIGALAAVLVVTEIPRAWWIVMPAAGRRVNWLDGMTMVALLGLAAAMSMWTLRTRLPLVHSDG